MEVARHLVDAEVLQRRLDGVQLRARLGGCRLHQLGEVAIALPRLGPDLEAVAQRGQFLRAQDVQHGHVFAGLEAGRGDDGGTPHLVHRVFQLRQAVGGVDVHQHQPCQRRGILRQRPFGVVGRPDADTLARLEPAARKLAATFSAWASISA